MYVACDWEETPTRCRSIQFAIASPLAILGFANSLTNPFIYAWWHNGFRESAKAIFCGAACRKKRASDSDGPTESTGRTSASSGGGRGAAAAAGARLENGNKGRRGVGISTTTLDASTTDVDQTDVDGSMSDVESALRYRVVEGASSEETATEQKPQQRQTTTNGSSSAVNVCYQPDATARH